MSNQDDKIALFDLDGTLASYAQTLAKKINEIKHPSEKEYDFSDFGGENPDFMERRRAMITSQGEFWENLELLEDGFYIMRMCKEIGFTNVVLTKGPYTKPEAWSHKLIWCHNYLKDVPVQIVTLKSLVYGRILVDDWPEYCLGWLKHRPRGQVIMPARPWNKDIVHPQIFRVDLGDCEMIPMETYDALHYVIKKAYER